MTVQQGGGLAAYPPYILVVALLVPIFTALLPEPERLGWFVAGIFVGHFLIVQSLRILRGRPGADDRVPGVLAYLAILGVPRVVAYVLVNTEGATRLRVAVS